MVDKYYLDKEDHSSSSTATPDMPADNKNKLLSTVMERTSQWIFAQEIPSDLTVHVGGASFSLHKFPLVSKSGWMRKKVMEGGDADSSAIEIPDVPGGGDAFELAAKFCYGVNFEITMENIAALRCAAEYLEMAEEYAIGNLIGRAEAYIDEVGLSSLSAAASILHSSQNLLPIAEKVRLVSRCIDKISTIACNHSRFCEPLVADWWAEDLVLLRIDMFQRVLVAMIARGFKQAALPPILMLYAKKSLRGLDIFGKGRKRAEPRQEHEKRVVLETIVSLLPREEDSVSVSFLSMLLRASIYLETTDACRLDLEKRIGSQLGQAALDDLLIPSYSFTGDTLFDIETVKRIATNFFECSREVKVERAVRLMENYLSEVAADRNLSVTTFVSLAEVIPEQARITEDGMYRAIDIYLKAHPALSDLERKKVCGVMDCRKLSREACGHAAQNDRLPVQTIVQVLYYEQERLREAMDSSLSESPALNLSGTINPYSINVFPVQDETSALRRENQDLKLELAKMKMRLNEMEKRSDSSLPACSGSPLVISRAAATEKPFPAQKNSFLSSFSRKLSRLIRVDGILPGSRSRNKANKLRRHSIS